MSRPNLARLGGFAAVIGGVLFAAVSAFRLVLTSIAGGSSPALIALVTLTLVVFPLVDIFVTLCFAAGLTGLYAFLGRRSVLGISGLVLSHLSILATVSSIVASFYVSYRAYANPDP